MAADAQERRMRKLKEQVEFYLSPRNLQTDHYLYGKMDGKLRVALDVVAEFPRIKELCHGREELVEVAGGSEELAFEVREDGVEVISSKHIKPALRTTLILREVPDDAADEEVAGVFPTPPTSIRKDINNTRFLTFATEADTTAMHRHSLSAKLRGNPVRARVKNESLGINMLVAKHEVAEHFKQEHPYPPPYYMHHHMHHQQVFPDPFSGYAQDTSGYAAPQWYPCSYTSYLQMPGDKGGKGKGKGGGKKGGKKGHQHHHHHHHHQHHQELEKKPVFTAEDFPTLVQADGLYEKEIVKYSKEDIIAKLEAFGAKLLKDATFAASVRPDLSGCSLALPKPDYSIELVKPVARKEAGESFADAVKKGSKKVVMSAIDEAKPVEKKKEEQPKPKVEEPPKKEPVAAPEEADDDPDRKKTFAEAVVHANDVRVPSVPYLQYRAGLSGNTVVAPGGSVQAPVEKEKKEGKKGGKGTGRGRGGEGGRGGRGKGTKGGEAEKKPRKKGEGKGGKGAGKKPVMHVDEKEAEKSADVAAPTPTPAQAAPAPAPTGGQPTTSWAQVASRLAKDEK